MKKLFYVSCRVKAFNAVIVFGCLLIGFLSSMTAQAVPSFARQTGVDCSGCHVGGYGPQLTSFGRAFKLGGYTLTTNKDAVPISAMLVGIVDQTKKALPDDAIPEHFSANNNSAIQEVSVFFAGAVSQHVGGFAQVTYSGIDRTAAMDNMDLRYATTTTLANENAIIGVSLNNNPSVQDVWNTAPAWSFPYMSSDLAPSPSSSPIILDGLAQQVLGLTTYVYWNNKFYAEGGLYRTQPTSFLKSTHVIGSVDDENELNGVSPYWRLVYNNEFDGQNISVGLFGLSAKIRPGAVAGATNDYTDTGVDATYEHMGDGRHSFTAYARLINETQKLNASVESGDAERASNNMRALTLNGSYYFENTYGVTLGYFNNSGSKQDATLFAPNSLDGSRVGLSDSNGYILQADYTPFGKNGAWHAPFANVRFGVQYVIYNKFNGASKNYDGFGRNAADNNTLMFMIWTAI